MRINCIAVGKNMPDWVNQAVKDYQKRLQHEWPVDIIEISPSKRTKQLSAEEHKHIEARHILKQLRPRDKVIVTEVTGAALSTAGLADKCEQWLAAGDPLSIIIGGPDGLAPEIIAAADFRWSLSPLTLPHPMVRIIVIEQFYRAWSILKGHPYHRA